MFNQCTANFENIENITKFSKNQLIHFEQNFVICGTFHMKYKLMNLKCAKFQLNESISSVQSTDWNIRYFLTGLAYFLEIQSLIYPYNM